MPTALALHHVDPHLLAVEKPPGLLSVPGRAPEHRDCVASRVQALYPEALTVHRLDQVTSGLLLFARGKPMQAALSALFERRQVAKRYEAVVEGLVADACGEISLPLICDWPNRPRQMVDVERGKPALTRWTRLELDHARKRTRLSLEPATGRSHQLRVHLCSIGHPIVGDAFYGAAPAARVCLHAVHLGFVHPVDGGMLSLDSPVPF